MPPELAASAAGDPIGLVKVVKNDPGTRLSAPSLVQLPTAGLLQSAGVL